GLALLPQHRMNEDPALVVHAGGLAVVVDEIAELREGRPEGGVRGQLLLDLDPDRHRIKPYELAVVRGHEEVATVVLFDVSFEEGGNLEAPLVVDLGRRASPQHSHPRRWLRARASAGSTWFGIGRRW